jgi:hypothetical protein
LYREGLWFYFLHPYFLSLFLFVTYFKITKLENEIIILIFLLVCISGAAQDLPPIVIIHLLHMAEVIKIG